MTFSTMAHLNVAEKRIEACIAYVGGQRAGKRANLERLRTRAANDVVTMGEALALDLEPEVMLGDCPVHVRLVAPTSSRIVTESTLRDVDGVVVILDATPSAQTNNQSIVMQVRSALRERDTPVVVQVNKVDLPDAMSAEDVLASLSATEWPHVSASAASDVGVDETFQRVIGAVMHSITAEPTDEGRAALPQKRVDGHPLLSALRRVLETTAEQQAQAISTSLAAQIDQRMDERLGKLEKRLDSLSGSSQRTEALESATELLRTQLASANEEVLKAARHACTREDLATATADIRTEIMHAVADKLDDVLVKIDALRAADPANTLVRIDGALRQLANGTESSATTDTERFERVETLLTELIEELRKPKKGFFG